MKQLAANKRKDHKVFVFKVLIYLSPFILVYAFPALVLFKSGEFVSVANVTSRQMKSEKNVLVGFAYSNPDKELKLFRVLEQGPRVIVLGSSRVMQFRSKFFKSSVNFYNAGGAVSRVEHLEQFVDMIPEEQTPEVIILGLDQFFFNPNWHSPDSEALPESSVHIANNGSRPMQLVQGSYSKIYTDYFRDKKYALGDILSNKQHIGLNAIVNENGFRNDGSYYYGMTIKHPEKASDYQFKDTLSRIAAGEKRFEYGQEVSEISIGKLRGFLEECRRRNIYLVTFLPPYAHSAYEKMMSMEDSYLYLKKLEPSLSSIFSEYGYSLYNFSDVTWTGSNDAEMIDGFHGSEKTCLDLYIKVLEDHTKLQNYSNISKLKRLRENDPNPFLVFGNDEL